MKKLPVAGPTYDYKLENIRNDIIEQELALTHRKLENIELGAGDLIYTDDSGNQKTFRTLQTAVDDPTTGLSANATAISGLETRVTSAEGSISSNSTAITSLQTDLTSAESDIAANSSAVTTLTSSVSTLDGEVSALSSDVTSLTTTVGTNTTNITTNASSINGIEGKYAVKINNNGHVSGFGLISTANNATPTSTFTVTADAFKIVDTSGSATPAAPFSVYTSTRTVDGVTVPAGVYMDNAFITSAQIKTLDADTITVGTLDADRLSIDGVTIDTDASGNLIVGDNSIGNSKISDLSADKINAGSIDVDYLPGLTRQNDGSSTTVFDFSLTLTGVSSGSRIVAFCTYTGRCTGTSGNVTANFSMSGAGTSTSQNTSGNVQANQGFFRAANLADTATSAGTVTVSVDGGGEISTTGRLINIVILEFIK